MLNDLRKIIEAEQSYDEMLELMMEAANDSIADMFIEDDGEAEIDEKEVVAILSKIPAYDEEEAMNKKLDKITECYIPEELTYIKESVESDNECTDDEYLEEGFKGLVGRLKRSFTKSGRAANVNDKHFNNIRKAMVNEFNAEEDKNELIAYKQWVQDCISSSEQSLEETEDKNLKDVIKYHIDWLTKFLKDIDKKIESVQESYELDDEYLEEGLFSKKTEVEIEIIYNDWEAQCSAYTFDDNDDAHCLKSVTVDLPEEFQVGSDKQVKGNWSEALINFVKKATKKDFKEYKIKRYFIH